MIVASDNCTIKQAERSENTSVALIPGSCKDNHLRADKTRAEGSKATLWHIFFATHRSYVPLELHRNTHFRIRSGQLRITSKHGNIVIDCGVAHVAHIVGLLWQVPSYKNRKISSACICVLWISNSKCLSEMTRSRSPILIYNTGGIICIFLLFCRQQKMMA